MRKRIHKLMILGLFMLGMTVSVMPYTVQAQVIDINSTGCSSWPYSTSGHFIPIYACYDATTTSCTKVMISDSHPNYNKRWSVSASIAYQVNDAYFNNAMIW